MGALLKPVTWLHGEVEARAVAKEFLIYHEDHGGTRLTAPLVNKLVLFAHGLILVFAEARAEHLYAAVLVFESIFDRAYLPLEIQSQSAGCVR